MERESLQSAIVGEMVRVATLWNEIENPNWSETRRRKGEEEDKDENDVAPLSSNGKSITIAPPTTTTFPSPIPSSGDGDGDGDHDSTPPAIIDMRKRSQRRRFSLLRERESWEVTADESLQVPTGFLLPMVWGFGVLTFRCKWEWDWDCVLVRESVKWETLNSRCHVRCHAGTEKWSTRAHQARVPQKVVYCYIFPKQCFGAKYFNN